MRIRSMLVATLLLPVISTAPADAQRAAPMQPRQTMPLTDLMALAKPYPNLVSVIRLQLLAAGQTKENVPCTSARVPNNWPALDGSRTAPYVCAIGKRTLTVTAEPTYYDRNGYRLRVSDPALATKAVRVTESKLKWTWK